MTQSGQGQTGSQTLNLQEYIQNLTNPTDFLDAIRDICVRSRKHGVSEQQVLDTVNQAYGGSGSSSGMPSSSR